MTRVLRAAALALALSLPGAPPARAQDFTPGLASGPQPGAAALLERALPQGPPAWGTEATSTRWFALPDLQTRALAAQAGARSVRVAAGLSQTGGPELGWTAAALAVGGAGPEGGAAVRAIARRERAAGPLATRGLAQGAGLEAGAGAWLLAAPGLVLWASAPQLWTRGEAPPLARPLELGARLDRAGSATWLALSAPVAGLDGERAAGVRLGTRTLALWAEARDAPWRASVGLEARLRTLALRCRVDAHPVLGETTTLALAWPARGPWDAP